jgi:hypothetical protein
MSFGEHPFERGAPVRWILLGSILVVGLIASLIKVCAFPAVRAARIDSCLDSGGSYDYDLDRCDHEASHPLP